MWRATQAKDRELQEVKLHAANAGHVIQQQRSALQKLGAQVECLETGLTDIMAEKDSALAKCECLSIAMSEVEEQLSMLKGRWSQYRSDVEVEMAMLDSHISTTCKVASAAVPTSMILMNRTAHSEATSSMVGEVSARLRDDDSVSSSQVVDFDGHSEDAEDTILLEDMHNDSARQEDHRTESRCRSPLPAQLEGPPRRLVDTSPPGDDPAAALMAVGANSSPELPVRGCQKLRSRPGWRTFFYSIPVTAY